MNIGPVHLVSFNSEYYYYVQYGWKQIMLQYQWLEHDLRVSIMLSTSSSISSYFCFDFGTV